MLTRKQEKLIKSLQSKKGREANGLCLVEGAKVIETAGSSVKLRFTRDDTDRFDELVTTETPQDVAATAEIPSWSLEEIKAQPTIVVLDGVQDPGNVGMILRLCLGFNASLILVESADVTAPKVVRSSVGAMFQVPWLKMKRAEAVKLIEKLDRKVYRLEQGDKSEHEFDREPIVLIAGAEGSGIKLEVVGTSFEIKHEPELESLNVASAVAIALYERFR